MGKTVIGLHSWSERCSLCILQISPTMSGFNISIQGWCEMSAYKCLLLSLDYKATTLCGFSAKGGLGNRLSQSSWSVWPSTKNSLWNHGVRYKPFNLHDILAWLKETMYTIGLPSKSWLRTNTKASSTQKRDLWKMQSYGKNRAVLTEVYSSGST